MKIRMMLAAAALDLITGCNSSPTVPIPPPTMISVSEPDNLGYVTVMGQIGAAEWGDVVLVFNDNTGEGAMKDAESDGSFEVVIAADHNHILVIQIKREDRFSQEAEVTVD